MPTSRVRSSVELETLMRNASSVTEVARALILPDLGPPAREEILSLLLIWDALDLEVTRVADEKDNFGWAKQLEEAGVLRVTSRPFDPQHPPESRKPPGEELREVAEHYDVFGPPDDPSKVVKYAAKAVTDLLFDNVQHAVDRAAREGLAPVAATYHASLVASLPRAESNAPVREGTLIDVATRGIKVAPETTVDAVLAFRERNAPLIGRFRAALIDLAASIDPDSSAPAEQAFALVKNRIEPAISALDDVLGRGKISFVWGMMVGASTTVAAGMEAGAAVAEVGQVVTRGIRYAFNRERLIRDHPYGFLYRANQVFDATSPRPMAVITDPEQEIKGYLEVVVGAAVDAMAKAAMDGEVDSTRLRRALDKQLPGLGQLDFNRPDN
jgi:hypothetical protein